MIIMLPIVWIIIAGMCGGIVRSVVGWAEKEDESFDWLKFAKSLVRAIIGGAVFAYGLGLTDPFAVFFAAITADVLWHDGYKAIAK